MPLSSAEFIPYHRPGFTSNAALSIYFSKLRIYLINILSTLKMISELAAFQLETSIIPSKSHSSIHYYAATFASHIVV